MRLKNKIIITSLIIIFAISSPPLITITNASQAHQTSIRPSPYAEETGYIYKIMNGKQYKRLWSYTYARWIDKEWSLA